MDYPWFLLLRSTHDSVRKSVLIATPMKRAALALLLAGAAHAGDSVFYASDYATGSTTAGVREAALQCGKGTGSFGCKIRIQRQAPGPACSPFSSQIVLGDETGNTDKQHSITLEGDGFMPNDGAASRLCYVGPHLAAGEPLIQLTGNSHQLRNFSLLGNHGADVGIGVYGSNAVGAIDNGGVIENVAVTAVDVDGIRLGDGTHDVQADLWTLRNLRIEEPNTSGVRMDTCVRIWATNAIANSVEALQCRNYEVAGVRIENGATEVRRSVFLTTATAGGQWAVSIGPNNTFLQLIFGNEFQLSSGGCLQKQYLGGGAALVQVLSFIQNHCYLNGSTNTSAHIDVSGAAPFVNLGNAYTESSTRTNPPAARVVFNNPLEATNPARVVDLGNTYGGMNTRPTFTPTYNNGVVPNRMAEAVIESRFQPPQGAAFPVSPKAGDVFLLTSGAVGWYRFNGTIWTAL